MRDRERTMIARLDEKKRAWERQRDSSEVIISEEDIAYIVSKWTGVPLTKLEEKESERLLRMREELHRIVVGQDKPIDAIVRAIQRSRAGLRDPQPPRRLVYVPRPHGRGQNAAGQGAGRLPLRQRRGAGHH